ncbi:MAG TPA: branched-chain amino acid ABC transporter permease [Syntrophorhabdaceae bacterium]|nr:branched-chain amino acid ABC transporter permease [Syntrophorhabdaceae bacterium]HPP42042.1 branched-chain amino acid ABC transporter permease [Syntrophorhabdaceae bacterium]
MRFFSESRIFLVVSVSLYLVMKALFAFDIISPYIQQICLYAVIVALTAIGLNVIYGYTGQFSLGHAAFYGIGAYASAYLTKILAIEGVLPFIPVLVFCGVVSGIMGYLIGIPILRLRDDFLAIATLGFGTLVRVFLDNSDKFAESLGGSRGFVGIPRITNLELVFFFLVFVVIITRNLIHSRYGLFWRCIKDDELAATSVGINTTHMKLMAFTYGCILAGIGGALYANLYSFLHPSNFDILRSIDFLIIVIIGGMGSIMGTIYASIIWVGFIEGLRIVLPAQVLDLRWVVIPLLLIALMIWRPYGLMTKRRR